MGKVTTYCQISGCSPEVQDLIDFHEFCERDLDEAPESERIAYKKTGEALKLLYTEDEKAGVEALSVIGPLNNEGEPMWGDEEGPSHLNGALSEAEGHVRELSGCRMGGMFDMGFCEGPIGEDNDILISFGPYFFVQTTMLAILEGATQGRVSVERLWRLVMMKGYFDGPNFYALPGVDYGPITEYQDQFPSFLSDSNVEGLKEAIDTGTAEDVAEVHRKARFWIWMRPDRFPVDPVTTPQRVADIAEDISTKFAPDGAISKLPIEIVQSIALSGLGLRDIITLATLSKMLHYYLLGNRDARDFLARAYIHQSARWCLPSGEAEQKWWNERRGDDALGWDYLRRCWSESHSMRNRRRVWRAAESIEEECERMGA